MLYKYNFSVQRLSKFIENNIPHRDKLGMEKDAEIIYYYLIQKYSPIDIREVLKYTNQLLNNSAIEIDNKMQSLGNNN